MRRLHHFERWDRFLAEALGQRLLQAEEALLLRLLERHYGKQAVLVGAPTQAPLLTVAHLPCHTMLSPLSCKNTSLRHVETNFHEIPILSGSVDLVILPHTLEFIDNPQHLLSECCRIIKPEGLIVIFGTNPHGLWSFKQTSGRPIQPKKIEHWLTLNEFSLEKKQWALYRPPIASLRWFSRLQWMESLLGCALPFAGGIYMLSARAKVLPLTPIRLKWKQQLSTIRLSKTLTGTLARAEK